MVLGRMVSVPHYSNEEARKRLLDWIRSSGRTQADVARSIGVSSGALSQWLGGTYPGDVAGITAKICALLAVETERAEEPRAFEFVPTRLAREILGACRFAHVHRDIAAIYGEAGMGKTVALKRYWEDHRDAVYMRCDPSHRSPQAALISLAAALGRKTRAGSLRAQIADLEEALAGTGRLLMFDEAQFLSLRSLEAFRTLHDTAEVGMVLCGNELVYTQMHGTGGAAFAQLYSRVGIRRRVVLGLPEEDVAAVVRTVAGDLPPDCLAFLGRQAKERGGIRRMVKMIRIACEIAGGTRPALQYLKLAENMLISAEM